ncbi:Uncharacterised protein [Vibrio cholerae]|nr:Uncharacterised protein [Vibrio cholerae]
MATAGRYGGGHFCLQRNWPLPFRYGRICWLTVLGDPLLDVFELGVCGDRHPHAVP